MPVLRRVLIFILVMLLLGVGLGWLVLRTRPAWQGILAQLRPPASSAAGKRLDIRPIEEEPAATSGLPLEQAVAGLDFQHDAAAFHTFQVILQSRLRGGRFDELEAFAGRAREGRRRFPGGAWVLCRFVEDLGSPPGGEDRPDGDWLAYMARLQDWMRHAPASLAAREAYAEALTNFAWKARGSGWASSVTEAGWARFRERLAQAREVLEAVPPARRTCPMWYRVMLTVALGQGWKRPAYDRLFGDAVAVEPRFQHFYTARAYSLLPRWYGEAGDWERFLEQSADSLGGEAGDALYYDIAMAQSDYFEGYEFYRCHPVSWPRMKRGFEAIERTHGVTDGMLHAFCRQSGWNLDRPTALALLRRIGDGWDAEAWGTRANLDNFKDWAYQRGKYAPEAAKTP